jgi:hypothetical protein
MDNRSHMNKAIIAFLAVGTLAFTLVGTPRPAAGQTFVQLDGRVQWIAGQKLLLLLDSGGGVDVDITRVPLDQYRMLTQGDPVVVVGTVSRDNRKVFASAVMRGNRWGDQSP